MTTDIPLRLIELKSVELATACPSYSAFISCEWF